MDFKILVIGFVVFSMIYGCAGGDVAPKDNETEKNATLPEGDGSLKRFNSMEEVRTFFKDRQLQQQIYYDNIAMPMMGGMLSASAESKAGAPASDSGRDYSSTNIQVEGVDEADFVKTDGTFLYMLSGSKLVIIKAYPAENGKIVSETDIDGTPSEFYVEGNDLIVFTQGAPESVHGEGCIGADGYTRCVDPDHHYPSYGYTGMLQYDISDRTDPELAREIYVEGDYFDSRMIGREVYAIVNKNAWYNADDLSGISPPSVYVDGKNDSAVFPDIYYPDVPAYSYRYSTVMSLDLDKTGDKPQKKMYLLGDASGMFVSEGNIYLVHQKNGYSIGATPLIGAIANKMMPAIVPPPESVYEEETAIHRIAIDDGMITYEASGSVPGHILNQFSMDEYDGNFRIATTEGQVSGMIGQASAKNNIYVLDMDLDVVGKLEGLAPGEKIYSARFMGRRGYLVTFQKVDPLFVIDLSDPEQPEVLGKLKIPGYSDYLHPVDETHLIGLGKDAIPSEEGDFSWYQGLKLSLFDVSDVEKPRELAKYEIGDRGTDSYALSDHKAFLFDKEKGLLVIPVLLAEIDEEQFVQGIEPYQYGDHTFQGAYVFNVDMEDGFELKGRISHMDEENDDFAKSGYYWGSDYDVKRSLFIEDVLYTVSDRMVKMNDLSDLSDIKEIGLPYGEPVPGRMYDG